MTAPERDPRHTFPAPSTRGTAAQPARQPVPAPLPVLMREVAIARALLAHHRQAGSPRGSVDEARARVIAALSSYTAALATLHLPVPYALRDELRLQLRIPKNR